jgi:hypothetical protein
MFKNWPAICDETDQLLMLLVATTNNPKTLQGLEAGFPYLFTETEQPEPRIPYSVLSGVWEDHVARDEYAWIGDTLDSLKLPYLHFNAEDDRPIPAEWLDDAYVVHGGILEKNVRPKTVTYKGEECAIIEYPTDFRFAIVVPTKFLDLDA